MAKKLVYNYQFIPGGANAGVIKVSGDHPLRVFLLVTNTTRSTIIYNFAGAGTGGTTTYDKEDDETTLTLEFDTSSHNTNDELQIFLDIREDKIDFSESFVDPVNKLRVSNPENLIDTDFEYGLQSSKWETVELVDNIPSTYTRASSVSIGEIQQINTIQNDDIITVRTGVPHDLSTGDPIEVQGTGSRTANGKYLVLGVSSTTEFSYRAGNVQNATKNIIEAYTTIIPGSFFASSDIDYIDTSGIATNEASPESTLTFTTDFVHGLSQNTSIYVTNTVGKKEFEITNTTATAQDGSPNINTTNSSIFLKQHNLVNNQRIYISPGTGGTLPTASVGAPLAQGESNCQAVFDSVNTACDSIRTTGGGLMTSFYQKYNNSDFALYIYGNHNINTPADVGGYGGGTDFMYYSLRYGDESNNNYLAVDVRTSSNSYRGGYYWYPFGEGHTLLYTGKAVDVGAFYNANNTASNNGLPSTLTGKAWKTYTKHVDNSFVPWLVKVHQVDCDFTSIDSTYNRTYLFDSTYQSKIANNTFYRTRVERNRYNSPINAGNGWYYTYAYVYYKGGSNYPGILELDITLWNTGWGSLATSGNSNWYQRSSSYSTFSLNSRDTRYGGMNYKIETLFMIDDNASTSAFGSSGSNQTVAQMASTIVNQVSADRSYASYTNASGENEVRAKVVSGDRITLEDPTQRPYVFSNSGTGPIDLKTDQTAGVFDDYYQLNSVTSDTATINANSKVPARVLEFTNTSNSAIIDDGNSVYYLKETTGHGIKSGSPIVFSVTSGSAVPGLTSGSNYYAYVADDQHFYPCASISDWESGINAITSQPAGNGVYEVKIPTIDGRVAAGGTVAITEGSRKVVGTDTTFSSAYKIGDTFSYTTTGSTVNSFLESRVVSVINDTELTLESDQSETRSGLNHYVNTKINIRADGQFLHRPFDGGVEITAGKSPDSTIVRQTRKYFRYQSGKGIQCSVAINFNPARPLKTVAGAGSTVTATTEYPHGLTVGNYILIQGVEEIKSLTASDATYNPNTGDLVITINGHGIESNQSISLAEDSLTFTCAKDGNVTNHTYPRSTDPAGNNARLKVLYADTNTIKVNVGNSSDTSTHTFVPGSATTNGVTHYDNTNPYNGSNYEVATVPDAFTFTYSASGSVTVASPTGIPEYAISRYKNAGVRCGLFDFQNGFFYEYDGKQLYAVRRSSVQQLNGTVSAVYGKNVITGDGSSFTKSLVAGDFVVLRGQSYKITSVISDKILNIQPKYQGLTTNGAVLTKTVDVRIPQSQWNIDKADGTGSSAFNLDIHKIQMVYLDYSWYGAGKIRFGFKDTYGHVKYVHQFIHNNRLNEAYMRSGNIPGRYEVFNKSVPDFVPSLFHWGTSVIMDGTFDNDDSYLFTAGGSSLSFANGDVGTANTTAASVLYAYGRGRYRTYYVYLTFPSSDATKFSTGTPLYTSGGELNGETVAFTQYSGSDVLVYIKVSEGYSAPAVYPDVTSGTAVSIGGPATGGANVDLNDLIPLISVRLAPSVDNNIIGPLGERDIINRMQLKLKELGVSVTHDTIISVLLNANNSNLSYSSVGTPSLSQYISHEAGDTVNGGVLVYQFRATGGNDNAAGKRLSVSSAFDLSELVDLGNSILGGDDVFPNGPDVMTICANVIDTAEVDSTSPFRVSSRLSWSESQA